MIRTFAIAAVAAAALTAVPARADWEGTRWGDPVDAVIATAGEGTRLDQGDKNDRVWDQDRRATRLGEYNGIAVKWVFFFDKKGGLSLIKIIPQDYANCPTFLPMIQATLGDASDRKTQTIGLLTLTTSHYANKDQNLVMMLVDAYNPANERRLCHLTYQPYGNGKPGKRG